MTAEEKQIWNAVYGADFSRRYQQSIYRDNAVEYAIDTADTAVQELREWRAVENSKAGLEIPEYD